MRTSRMWWGAGLGMALLLCAPAARADQPIARADGGAAAEAGAHEAHAENGHGEECAEGGGLYGSLDYLLLRARRRPHNFAIVDPTSNSSVDGRFVNLDWETRSGYRLGLGWTLGHGWEVGGEYFYFHSTDQRGAVRPAGGELHPTLSAPLGPSADRAAAASNIDMDVIDFGVAKVIDWHDGFSVRVWGGGRVAQVEQKLSAFYDFTTAGLGGSLVDNPIKFEGIGVRVGAEGRWTVGNGLSVWARMHGSLLSGDVTTSLRQSINSGATTIVNVSDRFDKVIPVTELGLGIAWTGEHVRVSLGYELANYFGLVDTHNFPDDGSFVPGRRNGDVSLEGLVLSLGFFF